MDPAVQISGEQHTRYVESLVILSASAPSIRPFVAAPFDGVLVCSTSDKDVVLAAAEPDQGAYRKRGKF